MSVRYFIVCTLYVIRTQHVQMATLMACREFMGRWNCDIGSHILLSLCTPIFGAHSRWKNQCYWRDGNISYLHSIYLLSPIEWNRNGINSFDVVHIHICQSSYHCYVSQYFEMLACDELRSFPSQHHLEIRKLLQSMNRCIQWYGRTRRIDHSYVNVWEASKE